MIAILEICFLTNLTFLVFISLQAINTAMNRSQPQGRGGGGNRPQGRGSIGGNNLSRQRPQPVNSGAGILGDGPSLMAMGMKPGQFKSPPGVPQMSPPGVPHMSPSGRMRNVSPGMQGRTRPPPQQFGGEKQNNQMQSSFRESQLQMMNSLLMKQQQQINVGRASLLGNMEGNSGMERNNFQSNNFGDDSHRRSMPRDLMSDSGYHDNMGRRSFPSDDMSNTNTRGGFGLLSQSSIPVGRSLLDDNLGQDHSIRESRRQDFYDNLSRDYGHGGRSSLLGENIGRSDNLSRSSFLGDFRGQDQSRRSTIGDDVNRSSILGSNINVSGAGILDVGSSLLGNMQDAIFSQNNQMQGLDGQGSSMQGIMGHGGSMQSIMGQGGNMVGQQGGNLQGIMGQQGGNRQGMRGQGRTNQSPGILGPGGGSQGIMGPGPQLGGQSSIPSLFDVSTNKRGGLLGKRTSYGGRDQSGQKRFRRNSGVSVSRKFIFNYHFLTTVKYAHAVTIPLLSSHLFLFCHRKFCIN